MIYYINNYIVTAMHNYLLIILHTGRLGCHENSDVSCDKTKLLTLSSVSFAPHPKSRFPVNSLKPLNLLNACLKFQRLSCFNNILGVKYSFLSFSAPQARFFKGFNTLKHVFTSENQRCPSAFTLQIPKIPPKILYIQVPIF